MYVKIIRLFKTIPVFTHLRALVAFVMVAGLISPALAAPARYPLQSIHNRPASPTSFTFAVAADMRNFAGPGAYDTASYFKGAVQSISSLGNTHFMISPGDIDPVEGVYWTITSTLGSSYRWYPVVGNHEVPGQGIENTSGANIAWLRSFDYGTVNPGPSGCPQTTYSFDYNTAHFVVLNEYCDNTSDSLLNGDVRDDLYNWLVSDLNNTSKPMIFVIGHEPAYPQPDQDNNRLRHEMDSLNQFPAHRDRFWSLLSSRGVVAYLCGHTHNYSAVQINHVWQVDAGHARGLGDTGAQSTFVLISVDGDQASYQTYRDDANGGTYTLLHSGALTRQNSIFLPILRK